MLPAAQMCGDTIKFSDLITIASKNCLVSPWLKVSLQQLRVKNLLLLSVLQKIICTEKKITERR